MDFTRDPIIETIITPKEGYKLIIRSSKSAGQEEYFVDAVEIVSFAQVLFFRSLEKPKAFIVPVSDYEVLEVREARMILKNVELERSIKIGKGKEGTTKILREGDKGESLTSEEAFEQEEAQPTVDVRAAAGRSEVRLDKKRDRRRHYRKRRGREEREEGEKEEEEALSEFAIPPFEEEKIDEASQEAIQEGDISITPGLFSTLLQPPPTLISETISRYRQNELFKGAFYLTEEEQYKPHDKVQELLNEDDEEGEEPHLQEPAFLTEESLEASLCDPEKGKEHRGECDSLGKESHKEET